MSREVGRGVLEAASERPEGRDPGWRAEQTAVGLIRGLDTFEGGELKQHAEEVSRAVVRGMVAELRAELGRRGDGPLTHTLSASVQRVISDAARTVAPLAVIGAGVFATMGLVGLLVLRLMRAR